MAEAEAPEFVSASRAVDPTDALLQRAADLAADCRAKAVLLCASGIDMRCLDRLAAVPQVLVALPVCQIATDDRAERCCLISLPEVPLTRLSRIKLAILLAVARGLLKTNDTIVCLSGVAESARLDTIVVTRVGDELEMVLTPIWDEATAAGIQPQVLERLVEIATDLATEGREGKPVGALFVVGDTEHVLEHAEQLVLNPFRGYAPEERNVLDARLRETLKEFAAIDGAFVIRGDGVVETVGVYLHPPRQGVRTPPGLGARHMAAAAITAATRAVALTVSESTGTVSVFRNGRIITELRSTRTTRPPRSRSQRHDRFSHPIPPPAFGAKGTSKACGRN